VKGKLPLWLWVAGIAVFVIGLRMGQRSPAGPVPAGSVRPELAEGRTQAVRPIKPPSTDELKIWARRQELSAELQFPVPEGLEKLSEKERQAKFQEATEAREKHEGNVLLKLREEFPGMKATDIPLALRKVEEFVAVITPRYYAYQEEEVRRLQEAGAFSDAALPLIKEEALKRLAADFPSVGEPGIKQLLSVE
jgi:hypothetical protein